MGAVLPLDQRNVRGLHRLEGLYPRFNNLSSLKPLSSIFAPLTKNGKLETENYICDNYHLLSPPLPW